MLGPLIDDLPTVIFVTIVLAVFFQIMVISLQIYNYKITYYKLNKYFIISSSYLLSNGILSESKIKSQKSEINAFLRGTKFRFDACLKTDGCCKNINKKTILIDNYLVPYLDTSTGNIVPKIIKTCMWYV